MRVEVAFLRSAVARRVFWVLLAAAALPLLVLASLGYGMLAERLEQAGRHRLQEAAKYAGLRVYDRLVSAQTALAALINGQSGAVLDVRVPHSARQIFIGLASVDLVSGEVQGSPELASAWRELQADRRDAALAAQRRLWWTAAAPGLQGRVVLGLRDEYRWWLAELSPDFLWGDLRAADSMVSTCVADARGVELLCPQGRRDARSDPALRSVDWSLFMRGDFGTVDWVFTRQARRDALTFVDLPLEEVAWKATLFSLLLVVALGLVLVRRTTVPLERLIAGTRRLAQRDWSTRVQVQGDDEFAALAGSFNDMATRIERQMQAVQVQSGIDREILTGLDLPRVLQQVLQRMRVLAPGAHAGLLLAPQRPGGAAPGARGNGLTAQRWQRIPTDEAAAAEVSMDPELQERLDAGALRLHGTEAALLLRAMGLAVEGAAPMVRALPAREGGQTRALLLLAGGDELDAESESELHDLCDRVAVMLVATAREQELRERAVSDSLTGLANRAGLIDAIDRRLAEGDDAAFVLAFIDLDGFKEVNDARGHPVGDALLCDVAQLLRQLVPPGTLVARPGGDEFVLLLEPDRAAADTLAATVCRRLGEPFVVGGQTLRIGASVGLAQAPLDGMDRVELMRRADLAMYAAKGAGRGRHAWFDVALDARAAERAWLRSELPRALQREELLLYFQPRVHADGHGLASVEALVRWRHPDRGLIAPATFVPLAEETGLIEPLGRWVLEAGCRQMQRWRRHGVAVPRVAMNVSALQLADPHFGEDVLALLRRYDLQPGDIEIEITESLFAGDADEVVACLAPLREAGVLVALDDFGTGFSSLSSLYRLPVDVLKIDRSFVIDLGQRASADAIARSIVALARALGKQVVAEGVETEAQHRQLLALGCDELQGYRFARPLPTAQLEAWVRERPPVGLPA